MEVRFTVDRLISGEGYSVNVDPPYRFCVFLPTSSALLCFAFLGDWIGIVLHNWVIVIDKEWGGEV